jgi:anti-sigma B factor antagonist
MSLSIQSRIVAGDVVVLDLSGKFLAYEDSLKESVNALLDGGRRRFLLNLAGVPYVGSWGITQIISAYTAVRRSGGTMDLVAPTKMVKDVFAVTSLDKAFTIYNDEAEALRASGK